MKILHGITAVLMLKNAFVQTSWNYTYMQNGTDWVSLEHSDGRPHYCGPENEYGSPINLMSPLGSYGWAYGKLIPKALDNHIKTYTDLKRQTFLDYRDYTVRVSLDDYESSINYFTSDVAKEVYNASTT